MSSKTPIIIAVLVILVIAALAYLAVAGRASGSNVAVQLTDPPKVPPGTRQLLITYSSVELHSAGNSTGQCAGYYSHCNSTGSAWINASGSGTIDLLSLANVSRTIANAKIASNSTINIVRFSVDSARIVINGTSYNVTLPNNQITVAVTGSGRIGSNASSVLIDFRPTVNSHPGRANATVYMLVPAASAVVVNSNASVGVSTALGSTASVNGVLRARLGLGIGIGGSATTTVPTSGNANASANSTIVAKAGQRISNFMLESVNYSSGTVSGLLYTEYPVASSIGINTTLHIGSNIGYACDHTEFTLSATNTNGTATFIHISTNSTVGGCPI